MDSITADLLSSSHAPQSERTSKEGVQTTAITMPPRAPIQGSLEPYTGTWDTQQAKHLLSRAMFGPTLAQIHTSADMGLDSTLDILLADAPLPDPPLNYDFENDIFTPIGETWIDKPTTEAFIQYRRRSMAAWQMQQLFEEGMSIREKMTLFWHNHFVVADIPIPKFTYQNINMLRQHALGNFRELVKLVTVDPSMLFYLNGNQNTKFAPNENYARELLELFTVGKGELAGPGDYSTFTEDDVLEISRILTGWRIAFNAETGEMPTAFFNPFLHDIENKQLSHRFDNAVIVNTGENEYADLIDVIFEQEAVSLFICRKLYRWFVYHDIDENIEQMVIQPMAQMLRDNDFEIKPVVRALLASEHFYDENSIGCIIKNPIDFLVSAVKQFEVAFPENNITLEAALWNGFYRTAESMQMGYFSHPDVAGWKAFYQSPSYYQLWINSATLPLRFIYTDILSTIGYNILGFRFGVDALGFTEALENPLNPNDLILEVASLLYPYGITEDQVAYLKEILIPGLPDFEWTVEFSAYLENPDNPVIRATVQAKLRNLYRSMLTLPEYQLG